VAEFHLVLNNRTGISPVKTCTSYSNDSLLEQVEGETPWATGSPGFTWMMAIKMCLCVCMCAFDCWCNYISRVEL